MTGYHWTNDEKFLLGWGWEKNCPDCVKSQNHYKVQPGDNFCRNCSRKLSKEKINLDSHKNEKQWGWREFWVGVSATLILSGLVFILIKLLAQKKK